MIVRFTSQPGDFFKLGFSKVNLTLSLQVLLTGRPNPSINSNPAGHFQYILQKIVIEKVFNFFLQFFLLQIVWNIEKIDFKLLAAKHSAVKLARGETVCGETVRGGTS